MLVSMHFKIELIAVQIGTGKRGQQKAPSNQTNQKQCH